MAESAMHFSVKSIGLSGYGDRKKCTLLEAARHNLREIQAERGASGHIDPARIHHNVIMAGPATAAEVVALCSKLAGDNGIDLTKLRKDHCQAIELVFSLPANTSIDPQSYFSRCLSWAKTTYKLPVLSATAHHDEEAKHLHALLLPVRDGVHVGSKPIAIAETKRNTDSFFTSVAGPFGLRRANAKLRGTVKQWACAAVLSECESRGLPDLIGPLWRVFWHAVEKDPTSAMQALSMDIESIRPSHAPTTDHAQSKPKGFNEPTSKPKGFKLPGAESENLSCVGFDQMINVPERITFASDAMQGAIDRKGKRKRLAPPSRSAVETHDEDGLVRVRDTGFDPTAWDD